MTAVVHLEESAARCVLLVQAFEADSANDNPQWTVDDRAWATRLARETLAAGATPTQGLVERARHAMQRLAPRDAGVQQALATRGWRSAWLVAALLLGLVGGLAANAIGSSQRVNLLAPPVWAVIAWNLVVYAALVLPTPGRARRWLAQRLLGFSAGVSSPSPMARFRRAWLLQAAPLLGVRAALLMHAAAAALAIGLMGGLYLRGLVLDYRAGWQSTFLDAAQVHGVLSTLLAPATGLTGIQVPDVDTLRALRVGAEAAPAATGPSTSAAPWIHLYAAMLMLFVVLPRSVLALLAAARAGYLRRRLPLALDGPYFQRLLRELGRDASRVQLLPHGAAPTPHALACLRRVLADTLGAGLQITTAAATVYGDEEQAAALSAAPGTTLRVALLDLAATPEDDTHGAFVSALRRAAPGLPLMVLADETAFRTRFAALPARIAERRGAWQAWAKALQLGFASIDLAQPDLAAAEIALQRALASAD